MKQFLPTLAMLLVSLATTPSKAQETLRQRTYAVEINPLAYAFNGWSLGFAYQSPQAKHWVFNTGLYAFELPKTFVEQIPGNAGGGWSVKIRTAFTLGADYYPWRDDRSGLAFGLSTVLAQFELGNEFETVNTRYSSLYFVPRASYTWFAFKGLYLAPWLGVELHSKLGGSAALGSRNFEPLKYQFSPNLSIGYAF